ncbi:MULTISPECIES: winged helix-turn-helix transcriptional regulator [Pseudonocardia]|uniref:HxlR-like helix-turn-helix protein n=2 Tax=Pseudonocardia TaxID=1847 RepID=A0A1Y2MIY0_PSEAH|nr:MULTISPECIES: helix-turn-helix domain-containing protein [Pseudonocardia]OSY34408.1 HxlR-like helix-turn-helix protein [Pseudonocardia autotrophica]TDN73768.1 HxlR family transcriptional regulator [Pseudonocardia autotrophica]BBG04514.1 HxlR family transcriptional regulator [Pseudonocardia autotrophica]GEC29781.1 HxlR family transcriptional regulator [Pseudonocardia saturnea]
MQAQKLGAVGRGLGLLADTWTLLILQRAALGVRRYAGWRDTLNISDATLSARLRSLVDAGLLETRPYREGGRERREYALTERGADIWKLLLATWHWEKTRVPREVPLPDIVHRACGAPAGVLTCCGFCGEQAGPRDTEVYRTPGTPGLEQLARQHPRRTRGRLPEDSMSLLPGAMEIIGDRWGATVLGAALTGLRSFSAIADALAISPEVLSDRLRRFVELGVLERTGAGAYRLTEKGIASFPIFACLVDWSHRWHAGVDGSPIDFTIRHRACGAVLQVRLVCDRCGEAFDRGSVSPVQPS